MIQSPTIDEALALEDYAGIADLAAAVRDLRHEAGTIIPRLEGRTVWMVNSTAQGGGVAEMLPKMVTLLQELGLPTRWVVIGADKPEFFGLTKRLHNLIHGEGNPAELGNGDRELFEYVGRENAAELKNHVQPGDIVVIHDPQPLAMSPILSNGVGVKVVWRCHIGLDQHVPATRAAWEFLKPYATTCHRAVFSAPEYIPDYLAGMSSIIHPSLDPESHKNRQLSAHKLVGILCNSGLKSGNHPVLTSPFERTAMRLQPDGSFAPTANGDEIGLLYRPIVTQVSRWDRLKGFPPLIDAFARLKARRHDQKRDYDERHRRRLEILRLVLVGPDPAYIQDDPEGLGVLEELRRSYMNLPPDLQEDVALVILPMHSRKENALMVNALQRCSTVVVQNSLREGFGLTATEAMWKGVAMLGTRACGLRQQIRHGVDGLLTRDPLNSEEIADNLDQLLGDVPMRDSLARNARRRVYEEFLVFSQLRHWLRMFDRCANGGNGELVSGGPRA